MRIWELEAGIDSVEAAIQIDDAPKQPAIEGHWLVILDDESDNELQQRAREHAAGRFSRIYVLKPPFPSPLVRTLAFGLFCVIDELSPNFGYMRYVEDGWHDIHDACTIGAIHSLFHVIQTIGPDPICTKVLETSLPELIESLSHEKFGDLGVRMSACLSSTLNLFRTYETRLYGPDPSSLGTLRSCELGDAMVVRWSGMANTDLSWLRNLAPDLKDAVDLVTSILRRCTLDETYRRPDYSSEYWPLLLAATAGWFARLGVNAKRRNAGALWVLCLQRALELSLQAMAFRYGHASFQPNSGRLLVEEQRSAGSGMLVRLVESGVIPVGTSSHRDRIEWARSARALLELRNRSRLAHGVLMATTDLFDQAFSELTTCLRRLYDNDLLSIYEQTFRSFAEPNFGERIQEGAAVAIKQAIPHEAIVV